MQAMLLHHLGVPCAASIRNVSEDLETVDETWYTNPEIIIRYDPQGATIITPWLYSSFIWVNKKLSTELSAGELRRHGVPARIWQVLRENQIIIKNSSGVKPRALYVQEAGLPTQVLFEATSLCQCDCLVCYHKRDLNGPTSGIQEMLARVTKLHELGLCLFEVTGGEPFLQADLALILERIVEVRAYFYVVTNGELLASLPGETWQVLGKGLGLAVSLDGVGLMHDSIRRRPGLYDKLVKGLEVASNNGIKTYLISTLHAGNVGDVPSMIELAKRFQTTVHLRPTIQTGAAILNQVNRQSLVERLRPFLSHPNVRNGLLATKKILPEARYYGCGLRKRVSVDALGNLFPCVMARGHSLGPIEKFNQISLIQSLRAETECHISKSGACEGCEHLADSRIKCGGFCKFSASYKEVK